MGFPNESGPPTYDLLLKPPPAPAGVKSGLPKAYNRKTASSKKSNDTILIETTPEDSRASPASDNKLKLEKRAASQRRKQVRNKKRDDEKLASYGPQVIPLGTVPIVAPAQVGAPQEIQTAPPPPTNEPTLCAHPTPAPDSSQRQSRSHRLLASGIATLVTRKDDTPRPGVDLNHTPPALVIKGSALDTVCDKPSGISISNDEIDSEKTDAFGPFLLNGTAVDPGPKDRFAYVKQIGFECTASLQAKCKVVCSEFSEIFSDELAAEPADIDPFTFDVKKSEWENNKNRGPLRHTTPKKELELSKSINEMIKKGIVDKSTASYYSHPAVVQQTPDKVRVCRGLNACIEPASP